MLTKFNGYRAWVLKESCTAGGVLHCATRKSGLFLQQDPDAIEREADRCGIACGRGLGSLGRPVYNEQV